MAQTNTTPIQVLIAGASGLVGQALLTQLLADDAVSAITAPVRKPLNVQHSKLIQTDWSLPYLSAVDECYICLGTTIKTAGSQAAFKAIDFDLVIRAVTAALNAGAKRVAVVSSLGANRASSGFYLRIKGETEAALIDLAAQHGAKLVILRPSFLAGQRSEVRVGERIALAIAALLNPLIPRRYRPVQASLVAAAMVKALRNDSPQACTVLESAAIVA